MQVKAKVKKAAPAKRPSTSKRAPRNAAAQAPKKVEKKVARKATTTTSTKATKRAAPARRAKTMSNEAKLEVFKRFIREHHDKYLKDPNITSVGIRYKITNGKVSTPTTSNA